MEQSVFVQSRSMNENYCTDPFAVQKVRSHSEAIIFNNLVSYGMTVCYRTLTTLPPSSPQTPPIHLLTNHFKDFANRLQGTVDKGFDEVYSLIDLCLGKDETLLIQLVIIPTTFILEG